MSFEGSELVFQYAPGEGLQIHPLANFGKLNALWRSKADYDRMVDLLDELLPLAAERAGGVAWEYYYDFGGGAPPWVSSLSQGTGLQSMARAARKAGTGDLVYPVLQRGLAVFRTGRRAACACPSGAGDHYAQYSFAPGLRILNGFVQSLVGLYDFAEITGDAEAQRLFATGQARALRGGPHLRHRRVVAVRPRHGLPRVQPQLPQRPDRVPRLAVLAHGPADLLRHAGQLPRATWRRTPSCRW